MRVLLANPRGFCAGVNMAIERSELAIEAFRHADLRLSRDRPQPVRRRPVPRQGRRLRRFASRKSRRRDAALFRPRRFARNPPRRPRAKAASHRRHLPAGHQGPSGSDPVRQGGLHDRPDRPRRARRSDRHHGRSPRCDDPGRRRNERRDASSFRQTPSSPT